MKHACPTCGRPSDQRYCPQHRRDPNATRNPNRDRAAHERFARAVKKRDGYRCVECGNTHDLRACHLTPVHLGGSYHPSNGITRCKACDQATDRYAT